MAKIPLRIVLTCLLGALAGVAWTYGRGGEVPFAKHTIDLGASETCAFADINGDGLLDIVSGEYWYEAPRWTRHKFREIEYTRNYIDNFADLPLDVNGDGSIDIVSCSWFSKKLAWWQNPGKGKGRWIEHVIDSGAPIESAILADIDNDGKAREVLPQFGDANMPLAWYEPKNGAFVKHVVSPHSVLYGIGVGDINGDGRNDIVTSKGWFEAPPDPRNGEWIFHPDFKFDKDLSFMYVLDVNGDGRNDIVTSYGHDYGVFWIEQAPNHRWITHMIDDGWSQAHAPAMADINGDGRPELIVGKRYHAHNGKDPGGREPLGIYWYAFDKPPGSTEVVWTRHVIDYDTRAGGGMQVAIADYDKDGDLDFAVGGKGGLFLFENLTKTHR
jgi:hypothetical protein